MRRFGLAVALLAGLAGCLPDTLSDEALHAKVLSATAAKGGPGCGNGAIDEGETCDDANDDPCDACDKCQARTVLDCRGSKSLAALTNVGALQLDGKENWSIEAWFLVRTAPKSKPAPFLELGTPEAKLGGLGFMMGVATVAGNLTPACTLAKGDAIHSTALTAPITINKWHHLRCIWNAKDGGMRAALDGTTATEPDAKLLAKPSFDAASWLLLGQMPTRNPKGETVAEPFDGEIDEVRAAQGPNVATTAIARRYAADSAETVALYHMDPLQPARAFADATANHLDVEQMSFDGITTIKRDVDLTLAAEGCYGYSAANAACSANPRPPWCPP